MARVRVGVALLIPEPVSHEVNALRRALGDGALERIPAHLTLVPPVNVKVDEMDDALRVLADAAAASGPLTLELGPLATFLPANPVLYLRVGGDVDRVRHLRDEVFRPPLLRPLTWPFVPHVTVADEAEPERIEAALDVLRDYSSSCRVTDIHLLQERPGRVWEPVASAPLG